LNNSALFSRAKDLQFALRPFRAAGERVVFVPTMGALHTGHQALISAARGISSQVWVSVFVNPTQFNKPSDLAAYPRQLNADRRLAAEAGAAGLFAPNFQEVYPGFQANTVPEVDYGLLTSTLEGHQRPGHFSGVVQVVRRLFELVEPDVAMFGEKDYQQLAVVSEMVRREKMGIEIVGVPTVRAADGLAMSSRNVRLSEDARRSALRLSEEIKAVACAPNPNLAASLALAKLAADPLITPEYVAVVAADTFEQWTPELSTAARVLVAAQVGGVRLIDNIAVQPA
jgi:pantoate--beta-alanine ligase